MLHVAPEPALEKLFSKQIGSGYLTADLYNSNVMVKMDITDIQYPDEHSMLYFAAMFLSMLMMTEKL